MKNITHLMRVFAIAAIACLSPMSHADDATLSGFGEPGVQPVRYYAYEDVDGKGAMLVQDGPKSPNGCPITVTIYADGSAYSGTGWRSLASETTYWFAECEFEVYGNGISAKFTGYLRVKPGPGAAAPGKYFVNGFGSPYEWQCYLN